MANKTSIEWCRTYAADGSFTEGYSVNPIRFRPHGSDRLTTMCQKVSPGCAHCYAEGITRRFWPKDATEKSPGYTALGVVAGEFVLDEKTLLSVLKIKHPARIFWGDMTDLFQESIPDAMLDRCFAVAALTPHLTHLFLTKRAERMMTYLSGPLTCSNISRAVADFVEARWMTGSLRVMPAGFQWSGAGDGKVRVSGGIADGVGWPLPNVQTGVSVENQKTADERIPLLLQTPSAVRFISAEPLLGSVKLLWKWVSKGRPFGGGPMVNFAEPWKEPELLPVIDWVIVGGESGHGARPMHPDWARWLRDQCVAAEVPFFMKQMGSSFGPNKGGAIPDDLNIRQFPEANHA